jgi:hypothetical protein
MEFRKLSASQLHVAAIARGERAFANMRAMGGDVLAALKNTKTEDVVKESPDAAQAAVDLLNQYDARELLKHGIVRWSYGDKVPADPFTVLDDETAEWAARQIATLSKRQRTETETKNG